MKLNIDIVIHCATPDHLADFCAGALGYNKIGWFDPYFLPAPPVTGFPSIILKKVTEPKTTTRGQLSIRADDIRGEAERLERLGATRLDDVHSELNATPSPIAAPQQRATARRGQVPVPCSRGFRGRTSTGRDGASPTPQCVWRPGANWNGDAGRVRVYPDGSSSHCAAEQATAVVFGFTSCSLVISAQAVRLSTR